MEYIKEGGEMRKNSRFVLYVGLCLAVFMPQGAMAESGKNAPAANKPMFVRINPISIPVIRKNGTTSVLALDIVAEVKSEADREKVEAVRPKLRDNFIRALYGNLEVHNLVRADGALDIEKVKSRLMRTSLYVMKESTITDILFNNVNHRAF
jgi:flagellar basal body-associated protein FliL